MKTLTYAAVMLAVIAGSAPAMAQVMQPAAPDVPIAVQAQPPLGAQEVTPVSSWAGTPGEADGINNAYGQPNQVFGCPGQARLPPARILHPKLTERGVADARTDAGCERDWPSTLPPISAGRAPSYGSMVASCTAMSGGDHAYQRGKL